MHASTSLALVMVRVDGMVWTVWYGMIWYFSAFITPLSILLIILPRGSINFRQRLCLESASSWQLHFSPSLALNIQLP